AGLLGIDDNLCPREIGFKGPHLRSLQREAQPEFIFAQCVFRFLETSDVDDCPRRACRFWTINSIAVDPSAVQGYPPNHAIRASNPIAAPPFPVAGLLVTRLNMRSHSRAISLVDDFPSLFVGHRCSDRKPQDRAELGREVGSPLLEIGHKNANSSGLNRDAQQLSGLGWPCRHVDVLCKCQARLCSVPFRSCGALTGLGPTLVGHLSSAS